MDYVITVVQFFLPFPSLYSGFLVPPAFLPPFSSCPWVIHTCSLASPFPLLFLTSPCLFLPTNYACYSLYIFPSSLLPRPTDTPPCDLHFCDSVTVLVVCLVFFFFSFSSLIVVSLLSFYCSYFISSFS